MKVLIWSKNIKIQNSGGPSGYLYNIKKYIQDYPQDEIDFYPITPQILKTKPKEKSVENVIKNILRWLSTPYRFAKKLHDCYFKRVHLTEEEKDLISKYDYIHIHNLFQYLQSFVDFWNGHSKIILTTHNPEPFIDQLAAEYNSSWMLLIPGLRNYFIKIEVSAYEKVDLIMFPVKEAREPYINRSNLYAKAFKKLDKKSKFFYVPTALNTTEPYIMNNHILGNLSLANNILKVCYVGRHNEVKGYDTIKNIAYSAWKKDIPVHFIIGGNEGPLKGLSDSRWHELGWINTAALLNEVDVFILPNKDTYFDLILLEVLRQGTPTMLTETGGNKWFKQKTEGLFFYEYGNTEKAVSIIKQLYDDKLNKKLSFYQKKNREFVREKLSMVGYIQTYLQELNRLSKN